MHRSGAEGSRPQSLLDLAKELVAESDPQRLLSLAMDRVIAISGAERGMLILFGENGEFIFEIARNFQQEDITHPEGEVSSTVIDKARSQGTIVYLDHAVDDPAGEQNTNVGRLNILSGICLPLRHAGEIFGVIYFDHRASGGILDASSLPFLNEFADFISLAAYRALERRHRQNETPLFETTFREKYRFEMIVGRHPQMIKILKLIAQVADTKAAVLILGESGTGKELVARAIHENSQRRDKPFVPINCAALPENLLESELFGYVRGAFTGAIKNKPGWFERAEGGTILLDEVGEMSLALQMKLLRFLQTGEYSPVGSTEIRFCDVRMVSATSRDLPRLVEEGKFREEVYYRLDVVDMWLPPLRDRKSDIPALSQHFLQMYGGQYGKPSLLLSSKSEALLMAYHFPGNVRELENIIQRAVVLAEGETIDENHLPAKIYAAEEGKAVREEVGFKLAKQHAVEMFERQFLTNCLQASGGNISRAAAMAEIDFKNFYAKMRRLGIDPQVFKKTQK